jgi:uncharacterized tellurite resistance protein B-like protein
MFKSLRNLWKRESATPLRGPLSDLPPEQRLATAVLLLEVIRADLRVTGTELDVVASSICGACGLSSEEAGAVLQEADTKRLEKDALDDAAQVIKSSFSREQKRYLLQLLWTVALGDERLERHEDNLVRKLTRMLDLNHLDLVEAKLKAEAASMGDSGTSRRTTGLHPNE